MSTRTPPDPDHVIHVTRDPRPDGGAVYTIAVDVNARSGHRGRRRA